MVRLDRVLVSLDWEEMFPNSHLHTLGSDASDHCPLFLNTNPGAMSKARFHFEILWPKFKDYEPTAAEAWGQPIATHGPLLRLDGKLRGLVRELQRWSSTKIGGIQDQLLMAKELIHRLDIAQGARSLSEAEGELHKRMKMRCLGLSSLMRTIARQRSRIRHLSEGDANTTYFHMIARGRKRRNFIPSMPIDGHVIADHEGMEQALFDHFSVVFGTESI